MNSNTTTDSKPRLFVLDTNVLMHDPSCLFRFQEHDIFIPMMVLEELDKNKRGHSDVARSARQASRFLADAVENATQQDIEAGLPLPAPLSTEKPLGKLYLQTRELSFKLPADMPGSVPDNIILSVSLALRNEFKQRSVTLVTKDINLRIKAAALGISAEEYSSDQVIEDVDLLYSGTYELGADFWDSHSTGMASWQKDGRTFYKLTGEGLEDWYPNQFVYNDKDNFYAIVRKREHDEAVIEILVDYEHSTHSIWGIHARNREQNFALNTLMDPNIDFVSLLGQAGSGKTLLTLAAGLTQTLEQKNYQEIIVTRVTVPVGEDIGFLPGTEEEKMTPWMGALMDNLEVLTAPQDSGDWERAATNDLLQKRIKIRSLNFMRGRTFLNKFVIIDEAQNLTSKQMKTLITRAGPGTKVVCLGNVAQIDTPYLTETTSGLTYVVDRFKQWDHGAHITLQRGERSRLADFASEVL
ncbi:MAG TPA: PhoH family protein [Gammaproteobacteria bacterium]|nr:PhoH family protein [Gammaproteobacteria bacterium]